MKDISFSKANLNGALFDRTDLTSVFFNNTDLTAANFVTAYNYAIDPELNIIKKTIFSELGLTGLLTKYAINIV